MEGSVGICLLFRRQGGVWPFSAGYVLPCRCSVNSSVYFCRLSSDFDVSSAVGVCLFTFCVPSVFVCCSVGVLRVCGPSPRVLCFPAGVPLFRRLPSASVGFCRICVRLSSVFVIRLGISVFINEVCSSKFHYRPAFRRIFAPSVWCRRCSVCVSVILFGVYFRRCIFSVISCPVGILDRGFGLLAK